jgi:nitrite reductase (NO-forming)
LYLFAWEKSMRTFLLFTTVCAMFGYLSPATAEQGGDKGVTYRPHVTFTLRTDIGEGKLVFIGEAGAIAGKINPDLRSARAQWFRSI